MMIFSSHAPLHSLFSFKVAAKNSENCPPRWPSQILKDPFYISLAARSNLVKKCQNTYQHRGAVWLGQIWQILLRTPPWTFSIILLVIPNAFTTSPT
ncbi:hypothetical protein TorRG33x02_302560 [Trema orientale]|uniref:Uncharacterized protein n=1 Tax=Trema orientale TaxID=63057 RepID=A0A2P5C072_TREOI|nr:hypothetical protein TorRG33x02_302560 [Trema orientale]